MVKIQTVYVNLGTRLQLFQQYITLHPKRERNLFYQIRDLELLPHQVTQKIITDTMLPRLPFKRFGSIFCPLFSEVDEIIEH